MLSSAYLRLGEPALAGMWLGVEAGRTMAGAQASSETEVAPESGELPGMESVEEPEKALPGTE